MYSSNEIAGSSNDSDILEVEIANHTLPAIHSSETENQNDQNEINPRISENLTNKSRPGSSCETKETRDETSTQETPPQSILVSTSLPRSLRIITSLTSAIPTSQQEVLTINTDFGSGPSRACSLLLGDQNMETTIQLAGSELSDSPPPRYYIPRRNNIRRSRNIQWISKCCNRSDVLEFEEIFDSQPHSGEAPPSYASLYTRHRSNFHDSQLPFLPVDDQSSFEIPTPPPSYAQTQGICMNSYSMDTLISVSSSSGRFLSSQSTTAVCPRCATHVFTVVDVHRSTVTHVTALILFMCGCWPCCMIPYCVDSCQTANHYCPICRSYLGTYSPW